MTCSVSYVGLVDNNDDLHYVPFYPGLNVVTGKSSTGKSAILEIFDYCFGSSEDTIPDGKISSNAQLFFVVLQFSTFSLILGRKAKTKSCFLKEITHSIDQDVIDLIKRPGELFIESQFLALPDFLKSLGRYFGVTMKDVDTNPLQREMAGKRSETPSVRSFTSFMLQHQNLIANKHAIFYRFDQKFKRDQAIEHFKILMGIVKEEYFELAKELAEARFELRRIDAQKPKQDVIREEIIASFKRYLADFQAFAGTPLLEMTPEEIWLKPDLALRVVKERTIKIDGLSEHYQKRCEELAGQKKELMAKLRAAQSDLRMVNTSIESARGFGVSMKASTIPHSADFEPVACPFCQSHSSVPEKEANNLSKAIGWLNSELKLSSYARESFVQERRTIKKEIKALNEQLALVQESLEPLEAELVRLRESRNIDDSAQRARFKMEGAIERRIANPPHKLDEMRGFWQQTVERLEALMSEHDVENSLRNLQNDINARMRIIGQDLGFERDYKPVNLKFDLDTFDLWFQKRDGTKVFLRSMGSGANWLYSHLTLFLALHYQFAARKDCVIPPILFLDQPTQVYFPSIDKGKRFDARSLAELNDAVSRLETDMEAVENMFYRLADFCISTKADTGVMPQLIVCDHADNLNLGSDFEFQSFVRATWRDRGFIKEAPEPVY